MHPRFSLRTLLILTALAAAACWALTRPTVLANRFLRAMNAGDYAAADQLFADPGGGVQARIKEVVGNGQFISTKCVLQPPTWTDWLSARRRITVDIRYAAGPDSPGTSPQTGHVISALQFVGFQTVATPFHVKPLARRN